MITASQLTWVVCALIGALFFFVSGYMIAARTRTAPSVARNSNPSKTDGPRKVKVAGPEISSAEGEEKGQEVVFLDALQTDRHGLRKELSRANARLERWRKEAEALSARKRELERENREIENKLRTLEEMRRQEPAPVRRPARLRELLDAFKSLRVEKEKLAYQIKLERRRVQEMLPKMEEMAELKKNNQELSLRVDQLKGELEVLEQREHPGAGPRQGLAVEELKSEVRQLQSENAKLRSMKILWEAPPEPIAHFSKEGLGQMFQQLVNRLTVSDQVRGVALADELGLLIAGTSEYAEVLAALAAVFSKTKSRVATMLPLTEVDHLKIVNRNGLTLMMRPVTISGNHLVLSTLTTGEGPSRVSTEILLSEVAASA
jgi:predicted regulator of Ras-like GTPase activity (Roadblock/LC7/MglB family)